MITRMTLKVASIDFALCETKTTTEIQSTVWLRAVTLPDLAHLCSSIWTHYRFFLRRMISEGDLSSLCISFASGLKHEDLAAALRSGLASANLAELASGELLTRSCWRWV